jgi:hypothetical protein
MKKNILITLLTLSLCVVGHSQITPQFSFYAQSDNISILSKYDDNDYMTYLVSQLLLLFGVDSNKEKVQILHRMYEIEHTSLIHYMTYDGEPLNFRMDYDTLKEKIEVDFGANLKNNSESDGVYKLWFASPVTKIDASLFAPNVTYVKLPSTMGLKYESSPSMCVTNLSYLEGFDVVDNRALIDNKGTIIAVAVAGFTDFTIPNQVSKIGDGAFRGCTLNSIMIPENVVTIGEAAFELCTQLESVTILSPIPIQIGKSSFETDRSYEYKIYVPQQCYKAYRKTYPSLKRRFKRIK